MSDDGVVQDGNASRRAAQTGWGRCETEAGDALFGPIDDNEGTVRKCWWVVTQAITQPVDHSYVVKRTFPQYWDLQDDRVLT